MSGGDDGWSPLRDEPGLRARAASRCRELIAELASSAVTLPAAPLLDAALVFTWAAEAEELALDVDLAALATTCLTGRLAAIGRVVEPVGLLGGIAGVAWTLARLVEPDGDADPCAPILARLSELAAEPPQARDYDLVGGLVGLGVAGLERLDAAAGQRLTRVVLDGLTQASPAWWTPGDLLSERQRAETPGGRAVHGMAHGVAGAIAYLALLVEARFDDARVRPLLDGAVTHLLARPARSGVAWCTGELGIAAALLTAAAATGDDGWRGEALARARAAAALSLEASGVRDTGFCHGAAGVAHLFHRLAQATGDPALRRGAETWFALLLAMPPTELDDNPSLVTGAAGLALTLLAALSPVEPGWDRLFLIA